MSQVINDFIEGLKAKINILYTHTDVLDSSKVDQLENVIDKYGVLDTERYNIKDIDYIADIIGIPENDPVLDNYKELDKIINTFIEDFYSLRKRHIAYREEQSAIYNKYIDILSGNSDELFGDFDELDSLMDEMGIVKSDRWRIIAYIDKNNIKSKESSLVLLNLNSKLSIYNSLYLDNEELTNAINKYIEDKNIDIDMIPTLAKKIAGTTYDVDKTRNALTTIILNELYKQLKEDEVEDIDNISAMINNALEYLDLYEENIINPCRDIIVKYDDLLDEETNKGNNINDYMNISLNDIEKLVGDHDKAVALKGLPIIKRIKDTLNSMKGLDRSSDEYISYLKLLIDLENAYKEISLT